MPSLLRKTRDAASDYLLAYHAERHLLNQLPDVGEFGRTETEETLREVSRKRAKLFRELIGMLEALKSIGLTDSASIINAEIRDLTKDRREQDMLHMEANLAC